MNVITAEKGSWVRLPANITEPLDIQVTGCKRPYHIEVAPGPYRAFHFCASWGKPLARFRHPNMLWKLPYLLEYKHTTNNRKWWTNEPGLDIALAIPTEEIEIKAEEGYSYLKLRVNGVEFCASVSGGTYNGWTDFFSISCHTLVNYPVRLVKKIAEKALKTDPGEVKIREIDERYYSKVAAHEVRRVLKPGDTVYGKSGTAYKVLKVNGRRRRIYSDYVFLRYDQINWNLTAKNMGIDVEKLVEEATVRPPQLVVENCA